MHDIIKEGSIKQAKAMHEEALRRFAEDFGVNVDQEVAKLSSPLDHLEPVSPEIADPLVEPEEGDLGDQDSI